MVNTVSKARAIGLAVVMAIATAACSASTAHIGDFTTSADKDFTTPTTTFKPADAIYAKATAANVPGKVTLKFSTIAENVKGQPANAPQPALDKSFDLNGDSSATYTLTPNSEWPTGTYKITATLYDEDGTTVRDTKSVEVTVQ